MIKIPLQLWVATSDKMASAVPPTWSFLPAVQKQMADATVALSTNFTVSGSEIRPESLVKTLPPLSEHVETIYQMNSIYKNKKTAPSRHVHSVVLESHHVYAYLPRARRFKHQTLEV